MKTLARATFALLLATSAAACSDASSPRDASGAGGSGGGGGQGGGESVPTPPWLEDAQVFVDGATVSSDDCRTDVCRHNENVDMTLFGGAMWMVHRTAISQILGDNSSLRVYRSGDGGKTFDLKTVLPALIGRDIRDPCFYQVGDELYLKALTRLPVLSLRDSDVDTIAVAAHSKDGVTWSDFAPIGPEMWSFWRIKEQAGVYYSAAYADGDKAVALFSSTNGVDWTLGPTIYDVAVDTPLETELTFMPSGKLLALVRMDGTDDEILGTEGRLRTKVCWSDPPYDAFDCPAEIHGERLDGPVSFFQDGRLFVIARRHIQDLVGHKRTSLFEITGDFDGGGAIDAKRWGDFPSASDTSYAGVARIDADHVATAWYTGDPLEDANWIYGMAGVTSIWKAEIDFKKLR